MTQDSCTLCRARPGTEKVLRESLLSESRAVMQAGGKPARDLSQGELKRGDEALRHDTAQVPGSSGH